MRTSLAILLGSSLALTVAGSSLAQPVDAATRSTARQLGEDGMRAFDKGDCATAADKLSRAHDLVHVPTLAFYAGKCLEKMGRLVDAGEMYLTATRDPVEAGAPGPVKAAPADAERARKALLPRIPSVQLSMAAPAPDAVLVLDGKPVPPAMIGVRRPLDPGQHVAEVQRGGVATRRPFSIAEGESATFVLDVPPPMAGYAPGYPGGYPGVYPGVYPGAPPYPPPRPHPLMVRRNTGVWATGIVLIPVSSILGIAGALLAATAVTTTTGPLGKTDVSTTDSGKLNTGYALLGVGAIGLTGGIVMVVVGGKKVPAEAPPPADAPAPTVSFEPLLGPTSAGMRLRF